MLIQGHNVYRERIEIDHCKYYFCAYRGIYIQRETYIVLFFGIYVFLISFFIILFYQIKERKRRIALENEAEAEKFDAIEDARLEALAQKERDYENMEGQYSYGYGRNNINEGESRSSATRASRTGTSSSNNSLRSRSTVSSTSKSR